MQTERAGLDTALAASLERLVLLLRTMTPSRGLSMTAVTTLSELERSGPSRLTGLADYAAVTQPAMTQLVGRLRESGLVTRTTDPSDGRVVLVAITAEGEAELSIRREHRAAVLRGMLARLTPADRQALEDALPVIDTLTSMQPPSE